MLDKIRTLSITADLPDPDLYKFNGSVQYGDEHLPVDLKQFLYRGSMLQNSNFADAVVVYTGTDSKIVMNNGKYVFNQSQLDRAINLITLWNMGLIFVLAGIMTS